MSYKFSAIGEMNNDELDQLKQKNAARMDQISAEYFKATAKIKTAKQIMSEQQETFEIKERFKDQTINYPNYGRGLKAPTIDLNTFMVQEKMCEDQAQKNKRKASNSGSPQANV